MKDHNGEFSASGALELKQTPPTVTHLENQEMPSLPSRWAIHPTPSSTSATNITTAAGQRDHLDGKNSKMPRRKPTNCSTLCYCFMWWD
jgi:hypothetical protein